MPRYFIELAYKGTAYSGFQVQKNAVTIQSEVEQAFSILQREPISLTGSSRTDTGVHALQNYFHFDYDGIVHPQFIYKINSILPSDIVVKKLYHMPAASHARFDAVSREYLYKIHQFKNPFLQHTSYFFPYKLDQSIMDEGASFIKGQTNFFAFAKTNTQVNNFICQINESKWEREGDQLIYAIHANRFLRGMVRLVTASLLKLGRGSLAFDDFRELFKGDTKCGYAVPPQGLFLKKVNYPENYFPAPGLGFNAV